MITATLGLSWRFIQNVEMSFPGVPSPGQFVTVPASLVREKFRQEAPEGRHSGAMELFKVTSVSWDSDRLFSPARMTVHLEHEGGV